MPAALTIIHPFPSALNAALVVMLASIAGASATTSALIGGAMFGFQASIGALNDIVDAPIDARVQPRKPLVTGAISRRVAAGVAILGGLVGLTLSATFGATVVAVGVVGYGSGVAYDVGLRRLGLAWLCFAIAFPALVAWTWLAAAGQLPPAWVAVLPMAALAGPTIHLANALVDPVADEASGVRTLATGLGASRGIRTLVALALLLFGLGWTTLILLSDLRSISVMSAAIASVVMVAGVVMSARVSRQARQAGWMLQAIAVAAMGVAWLAGVV